jgi:hypothetical protein
MTFTSPSHAIACAHISDLVREAARRPDVRTRNSNGRPRRGTGFVQWLRRGQLGAPSPCIHC